MGRKRESQPRRGQKIVAVGTPATWEVRWHPRAQSEKRAIGDVKARVAMLTRSRSSKSTAQGCGVRTRVRSWGDDGSGLRELRPRRGRSRWRPIYRRLNEDLFAILSIAPEAEMDKAGYGRAVRAAKRRLAQLEKGKEKG